MDTWHWHTWQEMPYLTCSLLENFSHGFFTQHFESRLPEELVAALDPNAKVYRVKQVHGNTVLSPGEIADRTQAIPVHEESTLPPADGVYTEQAGQAAWVCSADCVPALIADMATGQVAAVHAGWRGTAMEIVPRAIDRLVEQGSQLKNLRVALGPAIAGEVYQVSTTVAAQVGMTLLKERSASESSDLEAILAALAELPDTPLLEDSEPGRARLDVRRVNALQLEQMGLSAEQIAIAPYCTFQQAEHFFSYRRDRLKKVQWSGIVSGERSV